MKTLVSLCGIFLIIFLAFFAWKKTHFSKLNLTNQEENSRGDQDSQHDDLKFEKLLRKKFTEPAKLEASPSKIEDSIEISLYHRCYPVWSIFSQYKLVELIEDRQELPAHLLIHECLAGYPNMIEKLDISCLSKNQVSSKYCLDSINYYSAGVISFYVHYVLGIKDVYEIPEELLLDKYINHMRMRSIAKPSMNIEPLIETDKYHDRLIDYVEEEIEPENKHLVSRLLEHRLSNIAKIGYFTKISSHQWFDVVKQYSESPDPNPIILLLARFYGDERFNGGQGLDQLIDEYIASGNKGGWGTYFVARRLAAEEENALADEWAKAKEMAESDDYSLVLSLAARRELAKPALSEALRIDPENQTFQWAYSFYTDLENYSDYTLVFPFHYEDAKLIFPVSSKYIEQSKEAM